MLSLKQKRWKTFTLEELFNIQGSKTTPLDRLKEIGQGSYPYVTTQSTNNGVAEYFDYSTEKGNVLTVDSAVAGFCSYQEFNFSASDHVEKLVPKFKLTKLLAKFLTQMINCNQAKFSYGYKASQARLKRQQIMLPINSEGEPDWDFMENYIKQIEYTQKEEYKAFALKKLQNLEYKDIPKLKEKQWQAFYFKDIFTHIERGKRLKKEDHLAGSTPYVSSTFTDNGVDEFVGNKNGRFFNNCLTIANSGSVGSTFFHKYKLIASDHVTALKSENLNEYIYLFMTPIINKLSEKYSFNREINSRRINRERLILPINSNNEPDYEYMEQYIKNVMRKQRNCTYLKI